MSTLSVTSVTSGNATTDFTLSTGNTSAGDVVIFSNGYGILLSGNSTSNSFYLVSNGNVGIGSSTPASELYVKRGTVSFEPANSGYYAASVYAAQNATTNYGLQVRTNWQAVENKIVSFGVVDAVTGTDAERFVIDGVGTVTISSNTLTLGTSTKAANGYTFLPNGMKMNWGVMVCNTTSTATWSSAFGTNAVSVSVTPISTTHVAANVPYVSAVTSTTGTIRSASTTSTATVYFMAIGY